MELQDESPLYIGPEKLAADPRRLPPKSRAADRQFEANRCYECSQIATRACPRCGRFCCPAHTNTPNREGIAVCLQCVPKLFPAVVFIVLLFTAIILILVFTNWAKEQQRRRWRENPVRVEFPMAPLKK
jgi:hypothetical protein